MIEERWFYQSKFYKLQIQVMKDLGGETQSITEHSLDFSEWEMVFGLRIVKNYSMMEKVNPVLILNYIW